MSFLSPGLIAIAIYGLMSILGGVLGYFKSKSTVSLISGGVSGVLLLILAGLKLQGQVWATGVAAGIVGLLIGVFIMRWIKTKKPIPAIPMVFFGTIAFCLILFAG